MRILLITQTFPPEMRAEAFCVGKLTMALQDSGHHVSVVCRKPSHLPPDGAQDAGLWARLPVPEQPAEPQARSMRKLGALAARMRFLSPGIGGFLPKLYRHSRAILERDSFDWIVTGSPSSPTAHLGWALKRRYGVRWACLFNDPSPWCLSPAPYASGNAEGLCDRFQIWRARACLTHADAILAPTRRLLQLIARGYALDVDRRGIVVPHIGWRSRQQDALQCNGCHHVVHLGSLVHHRSSRLLAATLIALNEQIRDRRLPAALRFFGPSLDGRWLEGVFGGDADAVRYCGTLGYAESLETMQKASGLMLVEAVMETGVYLPSKLADYAASGRPVLMFSPPNGTVADLVGGFSHPGFLGQDPDVASARIIQFLERAVAGEDLSGYRFPTADVFAPESVAGALIGGLESPR